MKVRYVKVVLAAKHFVQFTVQLLCRNLNFPACICGLQKNEKLAGNLKKGLDWRNKWNVSWLNNENSTHRLTLLMWKYFSFCASIHDSSWFCSNRRTTDCWHSMLRTDLNKRSETALDQRPPQHEGAYYRGPKSPFSILQSMEHKVKSSKPDFY